jgi:class 3 adenylate cyclase
MAATRRKLTTILSADVQGYSQLMERDEEATHETLKSYRDAMARMIEARDGRVVNTWGDGLIAEFPSVVEAVRAAVDVQNELGVRNAERPEQSRMYFRIGLNLGDVIEDGSDIYGDGVNVAARLQAAAEPGGILISRTVHDQVRNKLPVGFAFLGDLQVKNIGEPVPSFAVLVGENAASPRPQPAAAPVRERAAAALASVQPSPPPRRLLTFLAVLAGVLIAVNLLTWEGNFWAKWPLLVAAIVAGMQLPRGIIGLGPYQTRLAVLGLGLVAINLLTWGGNFWAIWPLLGLGILAAWRVFMSAGRQG